MACGTTRLHDLRPASRRNGAAYDDRVVAGSDAKWLGCDIARYMSMLTCGLVYLLLPRSMDRASERGTITRADPGLQPEPPQ